MPSRLAWAIAAFGASLMMANLAAGIPDYRIAVLTAATLLAAYLPPAAWRKLLAAMLALSILLAALALAQFPVSYRPQAIFGSPNFFAGYAALHIFLALALYARERLRRLCWVALAANLLSVMLAQSRGAFLGLIAGLLLMVGARRPRATAAALLAAAPMWLWIDHLHGAGTADPRWLIWQHGLQIAKWKLLLGWGQRDFLIMPGGFLHLYNVALETLVSAGLIGLLAGTWTLVEAARAARGLPRGEALAFQGMLLCWVTTGMFIYNTPATVLPLYAALGYLAINRDVADRAAFIDRREPLEHDAVRHGNRAG